ncbi:MULTISPECIES: hypothetical protein [unclassified Pseudomonas]|uniref:hypothetical protein n=1 Tax=unclassified Pseudomonas TaxID=196821 RepID=UPI001179955E|nr:MULTISPECIES: hypothetical protein [unclassified Pseudomonas]
MDLIAPVLKPRKTGQWCDSIFLYMVSRGTTNSSWWYALSNREDAQHTESQTPKGKTTAKTK